MSFYVRKDAINAFVGGYNAASAAWGESQGLVMDKVNALIETERMQGNAAESIKSYLSDAYTYISTCISAVMMGFSDFLALYTSEYEEIDDDNYFVLRETALDFLTERLRERADDMDEIDSKTKAALDSVSDIFVFDYGTRISDFTTKELGDAIKDLNDLKTSINEVESKFSGEKASKLEELIEGLDGAIKAAKSVDNLSQYTAGSLLSSAAFQKMFNAYNELVGEREANAEALKEAYEVQTEMFDELQKDYEERIKEAERAKLFTTIGVAVIGVALNCVTLGAATPFVVAGTTAAVSAVSAGINSVFDQRIGSVYCPGEVSAGKVIQEMVIAGGTSLITSGIGAGAGKLTKLVNTSSMGEFGKAGVKVLISTGESAVDGIATRAVKTGISEGSLTAGLSDAFNLRKMGADLGSGAVGGIVSEGTSAIFKKTSLKTEKSDTKGQRIFKTSVTGSTKSIVKGLGTRFTETVILTGDVEIAWKESFKAENIILDGTTGAANETISGLKDWEIDQKLQAKLDEETERLNKGPDRKKKTPLEFAESHGYKGVKEGKNGGVSFVECDEMIVKDKDGNGVSVNIKTENNGRRTAMKKVDSKTLYDDLIKSGRFEEGTLTYKDRKIYYNGKPCSVHYQSDYDMNKGTITVELLNKEPKYLGARSDRMKESAYASAYDGDYGKVSKLSYEERYRILNNPTDDDLKKLANSDYRKELLGDYKNANSKWLVGNIKSTIEQSVSTYQAHVDMPSYLGEQERDSVLSELKELNATAKTDEEKIRAQKMQAKWKAFDGPDTLGGFQADRDGVLDELEQMHETAKTDEERAKIKEMQAKWKAFDKSMEA